MYAGGILSFYFIWFNPIRMSFQLCFISKCEENKEVIPKMDWKWPMPKMSEKLTDAGTIADPSSFHWEQHGGKWWPPPNEKLTRKLGSINQRDKSFLIRNSKKCPLLKNFVILLWLLDSKKPQLSSEIQCRYVCNLCAYFYINALSYTSTSDGI